MQPTEKLEKELRDLIESAFQNAVKEISEEEFFYVGRNFDRKTKAVEVSRIPWVRDLVREMRLLQHMYHLHSAGKCDLEPDAVAVIGAALFYFVNPYDVIPDHIPGRGYLDDVYVLNCCVARLRKLAPELVE